MHALPRFALLCDTIRTQQDLRKSESLAMLTLTKIRTLDLTKTGDPHMPRHLSAASGLACPGSFIYVAADDELHLGVFPAMGNAPGHLLRLFAGELPTDKAARKLHKPDLEAIAQLPPFGDCPHGALLALGSGSEHNRRRGALIRLDAQGAIAGTPRIVDAAALFEGLDRHFAMLNIEGAVAIGGELRLLQRANKQHPDNAVIRYSLAAVLDALQRGAAIGAVAPSAIDTLALGNIDGVPLSLTDGAALSDGRMVFTAVAEDTADSYNDGACLGAAVGIVTRDGRVAFLDRIDGCHKVEGIAARIDGDVVRLLLVTDADDPTVAASLFSSTIPNISSMNAGA
jgi:hypothetical protein